MLTIFYIILDLAIAATVYVVMMKSLIMEDKSNDSITRIAKRSRN